MKRILFAAGALLLSTPALAQVPPPGWNGGPQQGWHRGPGWDANAFWRGAPDNPRDRIQFLKDRVDRGFANGSLNRYEATRVNGELNGLQRWIERKHWEDQGPLNPYQRAQVQGKLDQISRQIRWLGHHDW